MSTLIKRLSQNGQEFVPITLQEAVVVNTANLPLLNGMNITTLDKVLYAILGLVSSSVSEEELNQIVSNINTELQKKQDKLTAGTGIEISDDGVISCTTSLELYKIVSSLPEPSEDHLNKIYLKHNGVDFEEYICIKIGSTYQWEMFGTLKTDLNVDNFVTKDQLAQQLGSIQEQISLKIEAVDVTTSSGQKIQVNYNIPNDLYNSAISQNNDYII